MFNSNSGVYRQVRQTKCARRVQDISSVKRLTCMNNFKHSLSVDFNNSVTEVFPNKN